MTTSNEPSAKFDSAAFAVRSMNDLEPLLGSVKGVARPFRWQSAKPGSEP